MKILITGAAGMLASAIISELEQSGSTIFGEAIELLKGDIHLRVPDIFRIDVSNREEIEDRIVMKKPDFFFHLAAETDVDLCEKNPERADRINYIGTENVALLCQKYDIPLVYISTAAVFDGNKPEPYTEFDEPRPANIYGRSKLWGEIAVQRLLKRYFIVRAGWMVGGWEIDKKFVYKIVKQLQEGKKEIQVVNDKFGSPTFTGDFARNLLPLIRTKRYGLYHMANTGWGSRYDIALKIVEFMGIEGKVRVNPVSSEAFPLPAPRPRSEMMLNYHLELIGMNYMPPWEKSLKAYIIANSSKRGL
jgi:dTDP-4-dehydrorhamnose reductase